MENKLVLWISVHAILLLLYHTFCYYCRDTPIRCWQESRAWSLLYVVPSAIYSLRLFACIFCSFLQFYRSPFEVLHPLTALLVITTACFHRWLSAPSPRKMSFTCDIPSRHMPTLSLVGKSLQGQNNLSQRNPKCFLLYYISLYAI